VKLFDEKKTEVEIHVTLSLKGFIFPTIFRTANVSLPSVAAPLLFYAVPAPSAKN
jgi:hypothetical protein